ncbi:uncharacterized protein LOC106011379 [Aplysia californica]|uniref:Uncharacterized protein LOC106011379 n=1 Tax=Aplysia californica TaxID=6500 RepID=A0ABM0ZWZ8_APLCA|nr:uncharacterized protein LOC106011379 [Aplysia californica]
MGSTFQGLQRYLCFAVIIADVFAKEHFQYILAFPKHTTNAVPSLAISVVSQDLVEESIEVTVKAPVNTTSSGETLTQEYTHSFTSNSNEQWFLNLEYLVHFTESGKGKKQAILVSSTSRLAVQARSRETAGFTSAGSFNVLPISLLSHEYLVVTECVTADCILLVVNAESDNFVTINLKLHPENSSIAYKEIDDIYYSGQSLREYLEPLDVLQILGERTDLTGTWVTAWYPVAVIAGTNFDCVHLRRLSCRTKDMMIEQLPPVSELGHEYVLAPFYYGSKDTFIKIAYTSPSTTFLGLEHIDMNVNTSQNTSSFFSVKVSGDNVVYLRASAPVLVLQYVLVLPEYDIGLTFDSSAVVLYPFSKWGTRAEILPFDDIKFQMVITALCYCITEIDVGVEFQELYTPPEHVDEGTTCRFCSREMFITSHTTEETIQVNSDRCSFSGLIIALGRSFSGWAAPLASFKSANDDTMSREPEMTSTEVVTPVFNNIHQLEDTSPATLNFTDAKAFWETLTSETETTASKVNTTKTFTKEIHTRTVPQMRANLCPCKCVLLPQGYRDLLNETFLSSGIAAISSYLYVPRANLSRTIRSKMCAIDHRPSSTSVGFLVFACTFLPIFGCLIFSDCWNVLHWLYRGLRKKQKTMIFDM